MPYYYTPYIILPMLSAIVNAGLACFAWRRRRIPAALPFFWLMVGMSGWSLAYSLNTTATSLADKILCFKAGTTFVCIITPSLLALALESVGLGKWLTRRRLALACVIPFISLLMVWTNEHHTLFRYDLHLLRSGPLLVLGFKNGAYFPVHILYIYLVNCAAIVLFASGFRRLPGSEWPRFALMIAATLIPMLVELLRITPVKGFSSTTSTLLFSGVFYAMAIFRHRLLDVVPLARTALFDQICEPVLVFDHRGELVDCNLAARQLTGGGKEADIAAIHRAVRARLSSLCVTEDLASACRSEEYVPDAVELGRYWRLTSSALAAGAIRGTLVLLHDVSDLKHTESRLTDSDLHLRELNNTLQERVEEETRRRVAQERLMANQSRLAAMGEMIGAIAHQWRQPLATLGMIVQRAHAVGTMQGLTREQLDEFKAGAMRQVRYMSDTIEEFRGFYRQEKQKEPFCPFACISDAVRLFDPQFKSNGIVVDLLHCQECSGRRVHGFPNEFKQVILNLLANARDAILDCRGVNNQPEEGRIRVDISTCGESCMTIDIGDNGCGIPAYVAPRIFDPYFTTKEESGGTGIGLYMSRMIVEDSLGGHLSLVQGRGGAVFRIELPLGEEP